MLDVCGRVTAVSEVLRLAPPSLLCTTFLKMSNIKEVEGEEGEEGEGEGEEGEGQEGKGRREGSYLLLTNLQQK